MKVIFINIKSILLLINNLKIIIMKIVEKENFIEVDGVILTEEIISMLAQWQHEEGDDFESGHVGAMKDVICWIISLIDEIPEDEVGNAIRMMTCLLYTSPSPRDGLLS